MTEFIALVHEKKTGGRKSRVSIPLKKKLDKTFLIESIHTKQLLVEITRATQTISLKRQGHDIRMG